MDLLFERGTASNNGDFWPGSCYYRAKALVPAANRAAGKYQPQLDGLDTPLARAMAKKKTCRSVRIIAAKLTPSEIDGLAAYYRAGFR